MRRFAIDTAVGPKEISCELSLYLRIIIRLSN
jgi:hypothetical protein